MYVCMYVCMYVYIWGAPDDLSWLWAEDGEGVDGDGE